MEQMLRATCGVLFALMLVSCGTASLSPAEATTPIPPTATMPQATVTIEQAAEQAVGVEVTREPNPFPLSEPGPYYTGKRSFSFEDASRDNRKVGITVFYPAVRPEGSTGSKLLAGTNREADLSGAPYPLILTGPDTGAELFKAHLATQGFVMAIVRSPEPSADYWDLDWLYLGAGDVLLALDQMASNPLEGLDGVIDSDRVGVTGYSGEGSISLALSGVRVDPKFYLSYCQEAPAMEPALSEWYIEFTCTLATRWDEFASQAMDQITASEDGLWQPVTDERIRAVMPMAPDGAWFYGERGLATADRPVFIIAPTEDEYTPYEIETAYIFEHMGTPERFMVSFVGKTHMMPWEPETAMRINHFATAFFGYYLQGKEEYRDYFSEDFLAQFDDLAWGVYEGE